MSPAASIYDIDVTDIAGERHSMAQYRGRVLLIVNVASRCGFTPQYEGLEALYRTYSARGFSVLGFPCDQFGHQEPGTETDIAAFCSTAYGVTFPMFAKIKVNGPDAHPLYRLLKAQKKGMLGSGAIKWNFTKFLANRAGRVVARYAPAVVPARLEPRIRALIEESAVKDGLGRASR